MVLDIDTRMEVFSKYLDRTAMDHKDYQAEGTNRKNTFNSFGAFNSYFTMFFLCPISTS